MKTRFFTKIILITFCLTLAVAFLPATPVQAAGDAPETIDTRLENLLMREKIALNNQANRLAYSEQVAAKTDTFIQRMKDRGLDTSELEKAFADFKEGVRVAREYHDRADGILAEPAGFDENGKITNRKLALETVRSAGNALRRAHLELTEATINLRIAVREFIEEQLQQENKP